MATTRTAARTAGAPPPPELAAALALLPLRTPLALPRFPHPDIGTEADARAVATVRSTAAGTAQRGSTTGTAPEPDSVDQHQIDGLAPTRRIPPRR
jgi:hypothetical protein